ncbi:MAG: methyltransferase domain-containing protein [Lachnospiraceae bacterium]|jgi:ubiquinone/menaquinone biosynthesis C-methylase UbiE/DNA-binding transcriptional MerR regulator|nr:methyltransferase domain-containing protein [Lachnospiraceae bacterium]
MKKPGYYSSGEFSRMAHITLRTVRYYDKQNILKPSLVSESGARFYTDQDFARLQQILLLKFLGFSLDDIREMLTGDFDYHFLLDSLNIQLKLVQDKIEQMQLVEQAIQDTSKAIQAEHSINWSQMLNLIHLTGMEKSLKNQYQDASNISARINLHRLYSANPAGWFSWIYQQCRIQPNQQILEIGCGDGTLWNINLPKIPKQIHITLSDRSEGMLRDARRSIGPKDLRFSFQMFDCHQIPFPDHCFDLVIANHVLFYCEDIPAVCREVQRILKPGGLFLCSTYGSLHMKEVSQLVQEFNDRIKLSANKLYERFGRENGKPVLSPFFQSVQWLDYPDSLFVTQPEPLISYILSCHGNQNQYLSNSYQEFRIFVKKKTQKGFFITKDAGIFLCEKQEEGASKNKKENQEKG